MRTPTFGGRPLRPLQRLRWLPALVAALCLAACAITPPGGEKEIFQPPVWPQPPDSPRYIFETVLRSPADLMEETEEQRMRELLIGRERDRPPAFFKPGAMVATKGRVYVADTAARGVVVFDAPRKRTFRFGHRVPGKIGTPAGLAVDGKGMIYVADAKVRRIQIYDALGLFNREIGEAGKLLRPTGVAASQDGQRIYVIDRGDNDFAPHRLLSFSADGNLLWEIAERGKGDGQLNVPLQVATGPNEEVVVLDSGNFRVQIFSSEGKFLRSFGKVGINLGMFWRPRGLAVDREGRIYVTDAGFSNVQIFSPQGELLLVIGKTSTADRPGEYGLLSGVAVDETGRIYLGDQLFRKIEVIRPSAEK